jgi:hypothetical protein
MARPAARALPGVCKGASCAATTGTPCTHAHTLATNTPGCRYTHTHTHTLHRSQPLTSAQTRRARQTSSAPHTLWSLARCGSCWLSVRCSCMRHSAEERARGAAVLVHSDSGRGSHRVTSAGPRPVGWHGNCKGATHNTHRMVTHTTWMAGLPELQGQLRCHHQLHVCQDRLLGRDGHARA